MGCRFPAPFTILLELNLLGDELTILARPVVRALAHGTAELYELVLRHRLGLYLTGFKKATAEPCLRENTPSVLRRGAAVSFFMVLDFDGEFFASSHIVRAVCLPFDRYIHFNSFSCVQGRHL